MPDVPLLGEITTRAVVAVLVVAAVLFASPASAEPTSPLCSDGSWRQQHPLICDTGQGPFTITPGDGPPGRGGLLGTIGHILHDLGIL